MDRAQALAVRFTDWQLWFERQGRMARGKCQLRLEIESRLRAWLLRYHGGPLSTLSFEELVLVAYGRNDDARRSRVHSLAPLPRRAETALLPHASAA